MELKKTLAFTEAEYKDRLRRSRAHGEAGSVRHAHPYAENICYVGTSDSGLLLHANVDRPMDRDPVIVTRLFEQRNVDAFAWLTRAQSSPSRTPKTRSRSSPRWSAISDWTKGASHRNVGFLPSDRQVPGIAVAVANAEFVNGSGIVESGARGQVAAEIAYIRQACRISEKGMQAAWDNCRAGISENELSGQSTKPWSRTAANSGPAVFIGSATDTDPPRAVDR